MSYIPGVHQRTFAFNYTLFAGATGSVVDKNLGSAFVAGETLLFATMHIGTFFDGTGIASGTLSIYQTSPTQTLVSGDSHVNNDNDIFGLLPPATQLGQLVVRLDVDGGNLATLASGTCWVVVYYNKQ